LDELHSAHGLIVFKPAARNGVSSRVATENPFAVAIAAIWPSAVDSDRPFARGAAHQ
jgi:hypothetical protein